MPTMSSTFGIIHRCLLLASLVISVILVASSFASFFVSALPSSSSSSSSSSSPQAHPVAQQNIRGRPKDVRIPCNFNGYNGFFVKRWECDDRARKGTCFCAAVAVTDPLHNPFRANDDDDDDGGGGQTSPDLSLSSGRKQRQDYEECCMQIPCIKDAVHNPAGRYSCMDTTGILSPSLCYSGKGTYVPNLCPNLPETIQCCIAPSARPDRFQSLTDNNNLDFGVNDYSDFNFNSLPI